MMSEADEHEQALALEMGYQRRQWLRMQKLEKQVGEQTVRMDEVERRLEEQMDRHRNMEKQVELHRREAYNAQAGLLERCDDEREARQKELHGLRASTNALEGKLDDMLREAVRDLTHFHQKGHLELRSSCDALQRQHEDLVQDLGSRCKDLERLLREECAELIRDCTGRCADLAREVAEERDARKRELHGFQASIQGLETKFQDVLRTAVQDLTDSHQKDLQELRSTCDAVQRQHEDLVKDLGGKCKDLEHVLLEELRSSVSGVERKSHELVRETTTDLSKLMQSKHKELAMRMNDLENNLASHTHDFTHTQIHKCSLAKRPSAMWPTADLER